MTDQVISFSEDDAQTVNFPHHDPLVIDSQVANMIVARVLVDNGSSVNILFKAAFEKIGLTAADLSPCTSTLYGFSGEAIIPMGQLKLPVTMGDLPRQAFKYCTFVMVDCYSAYNAIFGRPLLVEFGAVTFIRHLCMNFPTESGICIVCGDQKDARQCYRVSLRSLVMMVDSSGQSSIITPDPEELDPEFEMRGNKNPWRKAKRLPSTHPNPSEG